MSVLLFDSGENVQVEEQGFHLFSDFGVEGAVCVPSGSTLPVRPGESSYPIVLVDRPVDDFDVVYADHALGGRMLAQYIHDKGHKNVGLLSGNQDFTSARLRRDGFLKEADGNLNIVWEIPVSFSDQLLHEAIRLLSDKHVEAVCAASDIVAIGVLRILREAGMNVPGDVAVVSFDDIPSASWVDPALTTIHQPLRDLGEQAVQLLIDRIHYPKLPRRELVLPVELIRRQSA